MSDITELIQAVNALGERIGGLEAKVDKILASASGGGFPLIGEPNAGALAADADAKVILSTRWDSSKKAEDALDPINAATVESGGQVWNWGPDADAPGKWRAFTNPSVEASGFFFQGPKYAAAKKAKDARPDTVDRTETGTDDPTRGAGQR